MRRRIAAHLVLAVLATGCGGTTLREYISQEGRYRARFSGTPKLQEKPVPTPIGTVTAKFAISEEWSGTGRMVMFADYPPHIVQSGNKDAMLDGACQGMVTDAQLQMLSKKTISMNGHPGREVSFESQPGRPGPKLTGRARVYLVGHRLYQVFVAGRSGTIQPEAIDGFLDSFALLDQGPGPSGPNVATGPPPIGPPPIGPPPGPRPGPPPDPRPRRSRIPDRPGPPAVASHPDPRPTPPPAGTLALYDIPEPASAAIEADIPGMGSTPRERPPGEVTGMGGSPAPAASAHGASIDFFSWVDEDADMVGGVGAEPKADGTRDQHLLLELDLPTNTILESMSITSGGSHRWGTQPGDRHGPIGIYRRGRPVARSYVAQVGLYSGTEKFDLYLDTGAGTGPIGEFSLEIVLAVGGHRATLISRCRRPEPGPGPLADARPSRPAGATPTPTTPPATAAPARVPEPPPRQDPQPQPHPAPPAEPGPDDRAGSEVPIFVAPAGGGATILSFDWVDRNEDYTGTEGRQIGPGGGKDEHYRLVIDVPAATIIEEIAIIGGPVRWTTRPLPRSWPLAVVCKQELKNRRQMYRLGAFSGRWTFDLYAESHESIRPGQTFGIEAVVVIRGSRHHLTARCQRR